MTATALPRPPASPNEVIVATEQAINALEAHPLAKVLILPSVTIGTADTRVFHGLGQRISGYWLVRAPGNITVFDGLVPETVDPANFVTLRLSGGATVALAVF